MHITGQKAPKTSLKNRVNRVCLRWRTSSRGNRRVGVGVSFGLLLSWNACENEIHHPNQGTCPSAKFPSTRNLLLQHIMYWFLVIWNEDFRVSSDRCWRVFVQFSQEILRCFFCLFVFVLSKTLRNISSRRISKNRNLLRLGRFEQKPEVRFRRRSRVYKRNWRLLWPNTGRRQQSCSAYKFNFVDIP